MYILFKKDIYEEILTHHKTILDKYLINFISTEFHENDNFSRV